MSARKKYRPKPCSPDPLRLAIVLASKVDPRHIAVLNNAMDSALEAMRTAGMNEMHWRSLADAMNVAEELMRFGLANDHADTFRKAQEALAALCERSNKAGRWTPLHWHELEALRIGCIVHKVQIAECSNGEYERAVQSVSNKVSSALRDKTNSKNVVRVAGLLGVNVK